jgi:hypothetical protein
MESLADLILATLDDIKAIVDSDYPLGTYPGVNTDGLNPLHIVSLHEVMTDKDFGQLSGDYKPVAVGSTGGPWLIKIPAELIETLANIAPHDMAAMAALWASTDRIQEAGWSLQDAEHYFAQLVHFSQTALFEGKELFLCAYS